MPPKKKTMGDTGVHKETTKSIFSSLGGSGVDMSGFDPDSKTLAETDRFRTEYIELNKIHDNKSNRFSQKDIFYLETSISKIGQVQPIILIPELKDEKPTGYYEIKVGSRRFAALNSLFEKAFKSNDEKKVSRFSKALCIVLPLGATEKEINDIYVETNTTVRQLSVNEVFAHFDSIFALDENGDFINIPKGINKYEYVSKELKRMSFDFSPSKVKEYLSIYTAKDERITNWFKEGDLTRQQAVAVSRMPEDMQSSVMDKFEKMTTKEIAEYIKTYNLEKKAEKLTKTMRGIDAIGFIIKSNKNIKSLSSMQKIRFQNEDERASFLNQFQELQEYMSKIEKLLG